MTLSRGRPSTLGGIVARRKARRKGKGEGSVFEQSDGTWRGFITIGYTADGKQVKKWRRGRTQREVVDKLNKIAALSGSRLVSVPERVTVEEWLIRYAELRGVEMRPSTRQSYQHYLSKILPELGHLHLSKLMPFHVHTLYSKLIEAGLSPSVRQHIHHFFKKAMKEALRMELVERNVLEAVDTPKGGSVIEPTAWHPEEAKAFLEAAVGERHYGAFYLMLTQGLRIGEVLGLRWSDLEGDKLHVQRSVSYINNRTVLGPTKNDRGNRTLYLSPDVLAVLAERREQQALERSITKRWKSSDHIFSSSVGTVMNPHNFRRTYRRIIKHSEIRRKLTSQVLVDAP